MSPVVLPFVRSIYLCERYVPQPASRVTLEGVFVSIRSPSIPFVLPEFAAFVQLAAGLGQLSFHFDIVYAEHARRIFTTMARTIPFPSRLITVQLAQTFQGCRFDHAGLYLVELFCNNQFIADAPFQVN
jgi:hypothetical protein